MIKVLVIGGTGLIGKSFVKELLEKGYYVRILSRNENTQKDFKNKLIGVEWFIGDLLDPETLQQPLKDVDFVFHFASTVIPQSSNINIKYDIESNLIGSINLLEQLRLNKIKRLIFISSGGAIYGIPNKIPIKENHKIEPLNSYGIVKYSIEKYLSLYKYHYGIDYCVLRVSNVFGFIDSSKPNFNAVDTFINKAIKNEQIEIWGDGSVIRDYIHIDDLINSFFRIIEYNGLINIFNIGSGIGTSLNQIIKIIGNVLNKNINIKYCESRLIDTSINILDNSLAKEQLKWYPEITLFDGIKSIINLKQMEIK